MTLSLQMVSNLLQRIKDLEQELSAVKSSIAEVESKPVVTKWQPKAGDWYVITTGEIAHCPNSLYSVKEFGTERQTKEQIERAVVEMRKFNRLLALRDELCGDDAPNWNDEAIPKYSLLFDCKSKQWEYSLAYYRQITTVYFTSQESVKKACDMLNSGEVEL